MSNSYTNKYEILKTFKKDELQNVLIGSSKEKNDKIVVINILHKNKTSKVLSKSQIPNGLTNLIHLEEDEDDLIVITDYSEGVPLDSYLDYFDTTMKHRINLAYEYMTKIAKYDIFHNGVKKILIDESQVSIKNNEIYFNELLFLDNNVFEPTNFNVITANIANIIEKIILTNVVIENSNNKSAIKKIQEFISDLKNNSQNFNSIEEVYDTFRKIYIYDLFMDNEIKVEKTSKIYNTKNTFSQDKENHTISTNTILNKNKELNVKTQDYKEYEKKKKNYIPIAAISGIFIIILLFGILYKPISNVLTPVSKSLPAKPEAYFEYSKISSDTYCLENKSKVFGDDNEITEISWKIYNGDNLIAETNNITPPRIRFDNKGKCKIVLTIKDKYENTDTYDKTIQNNKFKINELNNDVESEEKLDNLNFVYSNKSIVKDYTAFRSGTYSLKLGEEGKNNLEKIVIDKVNFNDKPTISMWIASGSKQNIKLLIKGYKNNERRFQNEISFNPKKINTWEMVEISNTSENVDKIEITFRDFISPIWLDDIEINSYK